MNAATHDPSRLETDCYLRVRLNPCPGDPLYLHLSDLRQGLQNALPPAGAKTLDFGCGGSPYRSLFQTPTYHRADLPGLPDLDFVFGSDSRVPVPDQSYDCVLSTQVLEHVPDPAAYLKECRRLLRPGGRLILSTHGLFPDHACPHDYRRWTADGLALDLQQAGFTLGKVEKLTTGPRALACFNQLFTRRMLLNSRPSLSRWLLRLARMPYTRLSPANLDRICDEDFPANRVVNAAEPGHEFYVALLVVAHPLEIPPT